MTDITVNYEPELHNYGLPFRMPGQAFQLKQKTLSYKKSEDNIHGSRAQERHFRIACNDDPGWLMYIVGHFSLCHAKHVAANIMQSYNRKDLKTKWLHKFDKFKGDYSTHLYILDALFDDDNPYRRSQFYEALMEMDGPNTSAIVLAKSEDPRKVIRHLGLKPHLLLYVK